MWQHFPLFHSRPQESCSFYSMLGSIKHSVSCLENIYLPSISVSIGTSNSITRGSWRSNVTNVGTGPLPSLIQHFLILDLTPNLRLKGHRMKLNCKPRVPCFIEDNATHGRRNVRKFPPQGFEAQVAQSMTAAMEYPCSKATAGGRGEMGKSCCHGFGKLIKTFWPVQVEKVCTTKQTFDNTS